MSRTLITHLGYHHLPELADVAAGHDRCIELRCAALAQITFKLRLKPWASGRDPQEVADALDLIRRIEPKAGKLSWYLRESAAYTADELETFLRKLRKGPEGRA